jgi:predicted dehydrogenase
VASANRVTFAFLGTARIADVMLAAARASRAATVLAVAGRDLERTRAWAAAREVPRAYGSYEDALLDDDVEAVYVALPNSMHVPWSVAALAAGKHVLCEKPLALTESAAERAVAAAAKAGRVLAEGFMYRHHPVTARLKGLVDAGAAGRPRCLRASFSYVLDDPDDIRLDEDLEGGALADLGVYCLSSARLLAGEPRRVAAVALARGGVDVETSVLACHDDGVVAHLDVSLRRGLESRLEVLGEDAILTVDDPWACRHPRLTISRGADEHVVAVRAGDPYVLQLRDFRRAVRGEVAPSAGLRDIVAQARAVEAVRAASRSGTWVDVPEPADVTHAAGRRHAEHHPG